MLNEPRERRRRSIVVGQGHALASSAADLGREWADASAVDAAEVDELHYQNAKDRLDARIAARDALGGGWTG